jgi:hypothetical protein
MVEWNRSIVYTPSPNILQPINREVKDDSYMSKFPLLEQRIREVKDTGDELIDTETLDIGTELLKWDLKEIFSHLKDVTQTNSD